MKNRKKEPFWKLSLELFAFVWGPQKIGLQSTGYSRVTPYLSSRINNGTSGVGVSCKHSWPDTVPHHHLTVFKYRAEKPPWKRRGCEWP